MAAAAGGVHGVSALAFARLERDLLLVGAGESVTAYCPSSGELLGKQRVLPGTAVQGFACNGDLVLVFGDHGAKLCRASSSGPFVLDLVHDFGRLLDLVLDARWLPGPAIAFCFAQGYVQVWAPALDGAAWTRQHQSLSPARCILYAAAFQPAAATAEHLVVAGGTVFGDLMLWRPVGAGGDAEIVQRLSGHRGPIFRVSWAADAAAICTAGDDRSVRVWRRADSGDFEAAWDSFGHSARVWDCGFVPGAVASVGEDKELRFWTLDKGEPLAILEAHFGRNAWRCAVSADGSVLATGGADSSIKLWDVQRETLSRVGLAKPLVLPHPWTGAARKRRRTAKGAQAESEPFVAQLSVLPARTGEPAQLLVASDSCELFIVPDCASLQPEKSCEWQVVDAEACFADLDPSELKPAAMATLRASVAAEGETFVAIGMGAGSVLVCRLDRDTARLDCLCKLRAHDHMRATLCRLLEGPGEDQLVLIAAAADSRVHTWLLCPAGPGALQVLHLGVASPSRVKAKRMTAACCFGDRLSVFGDHCGNVHFCAALTEPEPECHTLMSLHGDQNVGCIETHAGRVYTGGLNGVVAELGPGGDGLLVTRTFQVGDKVNNVQYLRWTQAGNMIVAGNLYHDFAVWDVSDRYLLLREHRGSWKTSGDLLLDAEAPLRECVLFTTTTAHDRKTLGRGMVVRRFGRRARETISLPAQTLGLNFHGRSIWAARFLPEPFAGVLFTGCEDGCLKLSRVDGPPGIKAAPSALALDDALAAAVRAEETTLPGADMHARVVFATSRRGSVRCCAVSAAPGGQLILATGGSEQALRVWLVRQRADGAEPELVFLAEDMPARGAKGHSHRVLGLHAFCVDAEDGPFGRHRVVVGTSEGKLVVFELRGVASETRRMFKLEGRYASPGTLERLFESSTTEGAKPVRSLAGLSASGTVWVAAGRTSGAVELWRVGSTSLERCGTTAVHQNGINSVSLAPCAQGLLVVSGGDDQALAATVFDARTGALAAAPLVVENACASALRGVVTDGSRAWACGLNQRVRMWRVSVAPAPPAAAAPPAAQRVRVEPGQPRCAGDGVALELCWDRLVDVPEVHALTVRLDATQHVAVAGLGLGLVQLQQQT